MMNRLPDERVDPAAEVLALLIRNGIDYRREKDGLRFALSEGGHQWETVCRFSPDTVTIYGVYPFLVTNRAQALERINAASAALKRGGFFLTDKRIALRVSADLFDVYSAPEAIARALEYNAGAMVHFWGHMAECAAQNSVFQIEDTETNATTQ